MGMEDGSGPTGMCHGAHHVGHRRRLGALMVLPTVLAAGCGERAAPGAPAWSVRDSADVRISASERPRAEDGAGLEIGGVLVTIGGGAADDLFGVTGGVLLPGGGMALAVDGSSEVRFHDGEGALVGAHGGRGDGPGEFRLLAGIGRAGGDTVWAWDHGAARASLLTPSGGVVGSVTLRPPLPAGTLVGRRSDGSLVVGQLWGSGGGEREEEGLVREPAAYVRYASGGALADTLVLVPGREVLQRREGARMVMGVAPFARSASHALLGDDLVVGDQLRREISVIGLRATLRIRWGGPPLDVTASEVEAWKAAQVAAAEASDRPSVRAWLADVPFPDGRPAYGPILTGADGSIWVAAYAPPGEAPRSWDVFDGEGRWLDSVAMPERFRLLDVGRDHVLGVTRDALDVERVELRRLAYPTG